MNTEFAPVKGQLISLYADVPDEFEKKQAQAVQVFPPISKIPVSVFKIGIPWGLLSIRSPIFSLLILIASLVVLLCLPQVTSAADSRWRHDGSIFHLYAEGADRIFVYHEIGDKAQAQGVKGGQVLFTGHRDGSRYQGVATLLSRRCGIFNYSVEGSVEKGQLRVDLVGQEPIVDDLCQVTGVSPRTLTFEWVESFPQNDGYHEYPSFAHSRSYFVDQSNRYTLVLDVSPAFEVIGELVDETGSHIAGVQGMVSMPRTVDLDFTSVQDLEVTGRATYKLLIDSLDSVAVETLDAGSPERFPAHLRRINGGRLPERFYLCVEICGPWNMDQLVQVGAYLDWQGDKFTSPTGGYICVETRVEHLASVVEILGVAELADSNACDSQWNENYEIRPGLQAIKVPTGLERWAIEKLRSTGEYNFVDYLFGPSGGSGLAAISIGFGDLLPTDLPSAPSREDIAARWQVSACKLKTTFKHQFDDPQVDHCQNDDGSFDFGFCFSITLNDHTSSERGFSSANLGPGVDDNFLIRSHLYFDVVQVRSGTSPFGYVERLSYFVSESKFARQPESAPAASATFRDIEHFQIGRSNNDLDEQIFSVAQQLVMASQFECDRN